MGGNRQIRRRSVNVGQAQGPLEMKKINRRLIFLYGSAALLCQPLAACGDARNAPPVQDSAEQPRSKAEISAEAPLVIAFGDSLYAGYQLGPKEGLAPQLQAALAARGVEARVHNAGVSGDTTAAGRQRLIFVLDNAVKKPALVLLGLGGNDMLRGIGPDQTEANLAAMLDELAKRDIPVLLTGMMAAPNLGRAYAEKFNPIFPKLAEREGVDIYPFILDGVMDDPALMLGDHIHPNAKGVEKISAALAPLVADKLAAESGGEEGA
jgi:acyl-CoA thioesterase-1